MYNLDTYQQYTYFFLFQRTIYIFLSTWNTSSSILWFFSVILCRVKSFSVHMPQNQIHAHVISRYAQRCNRGMEALYFGPGCPKPLHIQTVLAWSGSVPTSPNIQTVSLCNVEKTELVYVLAENSNEHFFCLGAVLQTHLGSEQKSIQFRSWFLSPDRNQSGSGADSWQKIFTRKTVVTFFSHSNVSMQKI